jgi:hypothetical protein
MNFPEATKYLLNGEYIRRLKWYKDYYIKLENDAIFDSDGTDFSGTMFSMEDIIANDWELYQPKLEVGTVVQHRDGTIGIIVDFCNFSNECFILCADGCLEKVDESMVSSIKNDDKLVKRYINFANENLKALVSTLDTISNFVNKE